jgi:hypothetical protein
VTGSGKKETDVCDRIRRERERERESCKGGCSQKEQKKLAVGCDDQLVSRNGSFFFFFFFNFLIF